MHIEEDDTGEVDDWRKNEYRWYPKREGFFMVFGGYTSFEHPDALLQYRKRAASVVVAAALHNNQRYIPKTWRYDRLGREQWIAFPGTVFLDANDFQIIVILRWSVKDTKWLADDIAVRCLSGYHPNIVVPYYGA